MPAFACLFTPYHSYVSKQYLDDVHCQSQPFKSFFSGYLVSLPLRASEAGSFGSGARMAGQRSWPGWEGCRSLLTPPPRRHACRRRRSSASGARRTH